MTCMVLLDVIRSEPGMFQALLSGNPLRWVFVEHLGDEVFGTCRDIVPVCGVESQRLFDDVTEDFFIVVTFERRISAEEHEKNDAKGPNIAGLVIVTLKNFWSNIIWCSYNSVHSVDLFPLRESFRQTKVNELNLRILVLIIHEEVLRLEISMDDAVSM